MLHFDRSFSRPSIIGVGKKPSSLFFRPKIVSKMSVKRIRVEWVSTNSISREQ